MKMLAALGLGAIGSLLGPATAEACGSGPGIGLAFLHRTLPGELPAGAFVAEVELDNDLHSILRGGLQGRVRRTIQGDYHGPVVRIRPRTLTSCDSPFANGATGFLIGTPTGMEDGDLVVDPWRSSVRPAPPRDALGRPIPQSGDARLLL